MTIRDTIKLQQYEIRSEVDADKLERISKRYQCY